MLHAILVVNQQANQSIIVWFLYSTTKHKKKVQIAHFLVPAHGQIYYTPSSVILMTGGCNNSLQLAVEN